MKLGRISWLLALAAVLGCGESPADEPSAPDASEHPAGGAGGKGRDAGVESRATDAGGSADGADADADADAGVGDAGGGDPVDSSTQDASPDCLGDALIESDADVAAFAHCSAIGGSLKVTGEAVTSLELPLLRSVGVDLWITETALRNLELPALASVGGTLSLSRNPVLTSIALPELESARGGLHIGAWAAVESQSALTRIELPKLAEVGVMPPDGLSEPAWLTVDANAALVALELPALQHVSGQLDVRDNLALTRVDFPALEEVGEEIVFEGNDALAQVSMPVLERFSGRVCKIEGKSLTSIDLSMLVVAAGALEIGSEAALDVVELPRLELVGECLCLGPTAATRIVLPNVVDIGVLGVSDNPQLTTLELPALTTIGFQWHTPDDTGSYDGGLYVHDNAQLASIALPALKNVGNDLVVEHNPLLASLDLGALTSVRDNLELRDTALTSFAAPSLLEVGTFYNTTTPPPYSIGDLAIVGNPLLQSLALPKLAAIGGDLHVATNASLPTCDALAIGAQLTTPAQHNVIEGNAGSCP